MKAALAHSISVFTKSSPGPWTVTKTMEVANTEFKEFRLNNVDGNEIAIVTATEADMAMIMTAIMILPDHIKTLNSIVQTVDANG